ncbi:MAG: hypothetical protein K8F91_26210, partial [Candidatus Obscuribacterales bacterium]|nr:hypothetical protein [Candidatus Obscuribacterales bacterium]
LRLSRAASLSGGELLELRVFIRLGSQVKKRLSSLAAETFPFLTAYSPRLSALTQLNLELSRCLDDKGEIVDDASEKLKGLRAGARSLNDKIKRDLNKLVHSQAMSQVLQEFIITRRNGRYVVPVHANKRQALPGIVHDSSQSGLTVFVEPMQIVEPSNRIRLYEAEAEREVGRIIAELCRLCLEQLDLIESSFAALSQLDVIQARARLGLAYAGSCPELVEGNRIELTNGRHPLLVLNGAKEVVANDFRLGGGDRTLVITGPNTGGKTVLLKQIGLMALMLRAGMLLPADKGSKISVFSRVWADIGDEQSIEQSLSTFSSHMQNIVQVVEKACSGMLILLDEIGVGTDPKEGAAIATACLEHLNDSGALTVSTTHFSELKLLAYEKNGFINGSLDFDQITLAPTYKLRLGMPGSSKGVVIAERLGLASFVIDRVRLILDEGGDHLVQVMDELEARLSRAAEDEESARARLLDISYREAELEKQSEALRLRKEALEQEISKEFEKEFESALEQIKDLTRRLQTGTTL